MIHISVPSLSLDASGNLSLFKSAQAQNKQKKKKKKRKKRQAATRLRRQASGLDQGMRRGYGLIGLRLQTNFVNLSTGRENDPFIQDPSRGIGMGFGLSIDRAFNRIFGVRAEVMYQNKNFSAQGKVDYNLDSSSRSDTSTYLDYLEVPLMMVVRLRHGELIRPYVVGGIYGSFLITSDAEQEGEGTLSNARRPFSSFDAGLVFGVGSYFVLGRDMGYLSAELRYSHGMVNIADTGIEAEDGEMTDNRTPLTRQTYNTSNVTLSVGYHF
jgi:hypothetical protein